MADLAQVQDTVSAADLADELVALATEWRHGKQDDLWPWRRVIREGDATESYLRGITLQNFFYVRAAAHRQCMALAADMPAASYEAFRSFVADESGHDSIFRDALVAWGMSEQEIASARPLTGTQLFIDHQRSVACLGPHFYAASTCITELNPAIYRRSGGPYDEWRRLYAIPDGVHRRLQQHLEDDLDADHGMLVRRVLEPYGHFTTAMADRLRWSMRITFEAMWIWQRTMFEFYFLGRPLL